MPSQAPRRSRQLPIPLLLLLCSYCSARAQICESPVKSCVQSTDYFADDKIEMVHATTILNVTYSNTFVDFVVLIEGAPSVPHRLVKCGCPMGDPPAGAQVFFTNPKLAFVQESPAHGLLDSLGLIDRVKYVFGASFTFNAEIKKRVEDGQTIDITGSDGSADYSILQKDDQLGISILGRFNVGSYVDGDVSAPFIAITEVDEVTPLGRAEWMKVIGMLFEQGKAASDKFDSIAADYENIRKTAATALRRPSVFFNHPSGASPTYDPSIGDENYQWVQPGAKEYTSAFISDANADYRYFTDGRNSPTLANFSQIQADFSSALFLLNTGLAYPLSNNRTLAEFLNDPLVLGDDDDYFEKLAVQLTAVKCLNLWSNQNRITPDKQSSDFFESGVFQPDLILADYVKILHPEVAFEHDLFYMYKIGDKSPPLPGAKCEFVQLTGTPPDGRSYVDRKFVVSGKDRFEVDDVTGDKVLPDLRRVLNVGDDAVEIFYASEDHGSAGRADGEDGEKEVVLTVRVLMDTEDVDDIFKDDVLEALQKNLETDVRVLGDDDGLTAGAITGIVIGALVVLVLIIGIVLCFARRKPMPVYAADASYYEQGRDEVPNLEEGAEESEPFGAPY